MNVSQLPLQKAKKRDILWLVVLFFGALTLRLLVWHWHTYYPLGGDEQEYFQQALTLLREHRYVELRLMRPPLYGVFLAAAIVAYDSLVHWLRLLQAIISAATVVPMWLLTRQLEPRHTRAAYVAAGITAASYTLAAYATELLTETLFVAGITTLFWLILRAGSNTQPPQTNRTCWRYAVAAGVLLGLLCLTRSVALPLLLLGGVWLTIAHWHHKKIVLRFVVPMLFVASALLVIAPWSVRNYVTYGAVIFIDTTGAENLWLDNDPSGRESVKNELYALGNDRAARQALATQRGIAAIVHHPGSVAIKAWHELHTFFALEYADDMRSRRAIWVPPYEVWMRLLAGDALWVFVLFAGVTGILLTTRCSLSKRDISPCWLLGMWAAYTLFTALLFHVELRYRLPLLPILIPYAALLITRPLPITHIRLRVAGAVIANSIMIGLMLLHVPYHTLAYHLAQKQYALYRAEQLLQTHDTVNATHAAATALYHDDTSALARVWLAQAALQRGKTATAETWLQAAIAVLPAHPYAHLLYGDMLRQRGEYTAARAEFTYETAALQDLQTWSWQWFTGSLTTTIDVSDRLDMGFVRGFYAPEQAHDMNWRWTRETAQVRLLCPPHAQRVRIRMASGRPTDALPVAVMIHIATEHDHEITHHITQDNQWQTHSLPLMNTTCNNSPLIVTIASEIFTPRRYERTSNDGRTLGVMIDWVAVE